MRTALIGWFIAAALLAAARADGHQAAAEGKQAQTVLFMCPHGAAKSVLASAYFQRLAKERRLNVRVQAAGTEPDPTVSPAVAAHLEREGYSVLVSTPRKVTDEEFASADIVVLLGCDVSNGEVVNTIGVAPTTIGRSPPRTCPRASTPAWRRRVEVLH
jgi:hypothetical protein